MRSSGSMINWLRNEDNNGAFWKIKLNYFFPILPQINILWMKNDHKTFNESASIPETSQQKIQ